MVGLPMGGVGLDIVVELTQLDFLAIEQKNLGPCLLHYGMWGAMVQTNVSAVIPKIRMRRDFCILLKVLNMKEPFF